MPSQAPVESGQAPAGRPTLSRGLGFARRQLAEVGLGPRLLLVLVASLAVVAAVAYELIAAELRQAPQAPVSAAPSWRPS